MDDLGVPLFSETPISDIYILRITDLAFAKTKDSQFFWKTISLAHQPSFWGIQKTNPPNLQDLQTGWANDAQLHVDLAVFSNSQMSFPAIKKANCFIRLMEEILHWLIWQISHYIYVYTWFYTFQVVVWDFWTINSTGLIDLSPTSLAPL